MKKHIISNILFTTSFLLVMIPAFYLLINHILEYTEPPPMAAKSSLKDEGITPLSVNRQFSNEENYADQVTVLTYHQIIPENRLLKAHLNEKGEIMDTIVTLEDFTEQMAYLAENHTVLSFKEFEKFMFGHKKVPIGSVLITFDDGFKNVFEFAYPILKEHGFYATQFLITSLVTNNVVPYNDALCQYASIEELRRAADVFDYGSHTHDFHQINQDDKPFLEVYSSESVHEDLSSSMEWLGHANAFAAPYGVYNTDTLAILKQLKVKTAFTIEAGYAKPDQHLLEIPRHGIYPSHTLEEFENIVNGR